MTFRTDIQALRGYAVLLVILQHAGAGFIPAGFLGVDIFFVISGFLITGMLKRSIEQRDFSFSRFYFRRAKRLLPAAYVTFLATAVLAFFLLDAVEWNDFIRQLAGAVTFTGNLVLWQQTGYFSGAAALKPLLHVWSLAVEEQFYLLLPAAMAWLPRRHWLAGTGVLLLASLALCIGLASTHPDAAFYLLPARAWELAIGAFAALARMEDTRARALVAKLFLPALAALLVVPSMPLPAPAFVNIAIVCVATMLVIARRHGALNDTPIAHGLAQVGDASYSLYLVHWPIFAFINNIHAGDPSFGTPRPPLLAAAVVLALLLGFALYRYVELPVRRMQVGFPRRWVLLAATSSAVLALVPFGIPARTTLDAKGAAIDFARLRRDNLGFGNACESYDRFKPIAACENAAVPALMVWGDSFAMHLVPGIAATTQAGVIQATKSACGPLLGIAQITSGYARGYAGNCLAFNQSVIDYLQATPSIRVVVLSSSFYPYFDPERTLLQVVDGKPVERAPSEDVAIQAMRDTVVALRAAGKRVVVVAPPPSSGFDYTHCLERKARNRSPFAIFIDCDIPLADYHASKRVVLDFLARLHAQADVEVVSFDGVLCSASGCATALDGIPIYRDEGHLSRDGSRLVARRMQLGALLGASAR